MIDYVLLGSIALLYVLGKWQGGAVLEAANAYLVQHGQEPMEGFDAAMITWGWPVATAIAMFEEAKEGMRGN